MQYQHTNTSHNRSSGFSGVAEIAGGMGLRSPQPQQLALDFAPAQVRSHGLRDAHTHPQVARRKGESFRVPASRASSCRIGPRRQGFASPLRALDIRPVDHPVLHLIKLVPSRCGELMWHLDYPQR